MIKARCCTILIATCGSVERSCSSAVENWSMGIVADIRRAEDDIMCDETTVCSYAALLQACNVFCRAKLI